MFYDSLLLVALYFVLTAVLLYFRDGEAIAPGNPAYLTLLVAVCWLFHVVFWRRGGRTLGMQSWRLRLVDGDGNIQTIAGDNAAGLGYSGDGGPAISAQLSYPSGVYVDGAASLSPRCRCL